MCEIVERLKSYATPGAVHDLKHEALIAGPQNTLKHLCGFLGLSAPESYYNDCANIIYKSAHKTRHHVEWTPELIDSVKQQTSQYQFLDGYSYED